ncbi:MAG TPA: EAL domain-containing protein [Bacilli bacterium]|nr:EAL domain-containing protein [Bacilli bacterium]
MSNKPNADEQFREKLKKSNWRLLPVRGTLQIMAVYLVLGIVWIVLSDRILLWLTGDNHALVDSIQLAKGIFYVAMTTLLFYFLIKRRMDLYVTAIKRLEESNSNLNISNDNLEILERRLYELAYTDRLTGLFNKNKFRELLREHFQTKEGQFLGIVYIDIDNFRSINEVKGFAAGDFLITTIARDLRVLAGEDHHVFRFSDDLFVLLVQNIASRKEMDKLIQEYTKEARRSIPIDGDDFFFTVSSGIVCYPEDGETYETLMQHIEMALSVAKKSGPGSVVSYQASFEKEITENIELTNLLHSALTNDEIKVYFQPVYDVKKGKIFAMEALLRWKQGKRGFIAPLDFIPTAEKSGQIKELTRFVVERSFAYFQELLADGAAPTSVSINLSTKLVLELNFIDYLKDAIVRHKVATKYFVFEITESLFLENFELAVARLKTIRAMGFRIALDDFGTGYSSLMYLQQLPIDILKIDREFINSIEEVDGNYPLIEFMISLGKALGLKVVGEGVEEKFQQDYLVQHGIDAIQGYLYAYPMDAFDVTTFVMTHQKRH